MNWKKILFYSINFLTGFVVAFCGALQVYGLTIIEKLNSNFVLLVFCISLCLIWALLLFITSIALLFKQRWREEAFLMFAGTNAEDELEQAAVNDSIKQTFLLNLIIIASVVILSGFTYTKLKKNTDNKNFSFSYRLMNDYSDLTQTIEELEGLKGKADELAPAIDEIKKLKSGENYYLIPKTIFTPYGALCFILLQFIIFRTFLYFNRQRFL